MTGHMMLLIGSTTETDTAVTLLFGLLLVGLIACLALEEQLHAKKSLIAGLFAIVCLLLGTMVGVLDFEKIVVGSHEIVEAENAVEVEYVVDDDPDQNYAIVIKPEDEVAVAEEHHALHVDGHRISMPVYIPGIDWSVIVIILGSSLFVDVMSKSGIFTWIAIRVTKASRGDPLRLLIFYGVMTVVFSAVLNNVTAMIIVGSLTVVSLKKLGRTEQLLGFLLTEGLLTNIGGLLTLISSVPNIIVGTAANISFVEFFLKACPYVVAATVVTLWMAARLFAIKKLASAEQRQEALDLVAGFDENDGVESWGFFRFSAVMLVLFIFMIASTSALPYINKLGMGFVAMSFAGIMMIRFKSEVDNFYRSIDWDLLGFFMALFVVIFTMEHAGVLDAIGDGMQMVLANLTTMPTPKFDGAVLLLGSAGFSSVTDNIPLAAMLANILTKVGTPFDSGLWWSVIFGANLGGNLTPIGSASTLVAVTIMHKHGLAISFVKFVKSAIPFAAVQIVLATLYVLFILPLISSIVG